MHRLESDLHLLLDGSYISRGFCLYKELLGLYATANGAFDTAINLEFESTGRQVPNEAAFQQVLAHGARSVLAKLVIFG